MRIATRVAVIAAGAIAMLVVPAPMTSARRAAPPVGCRTWTMRTIASGLGVLENLTFDGGARC
jgi:hypothetical protein